MLLIRKLLLTPSNSSQHSDRWNRGVKSTPRTLTMLETQPQVSLSELLHRLAEVGGSDLHITTGTPPLVRVHGEIRPLDGYRPLTSGETKQLAYSVLTDAQKHRFEENLELHCQPTRSKCRHARVCTSVAYGAAPGPGCSAGRRNARSGNDRVGLANCGNRSPHVCNAAYQFSRLHDQSHH